MRGTEPFFTQTQCDRCQEPLVPARIMSWFTKETICMTCSKNEQTLRATLPDQGRDWEGCGYVPEPGAKGVHKELFPINYGSSLRYFSRV